MCEHTLDYDHAGIYCETIHNTGQTCKYYVAIGILSYFASPDVTSVSMENSKTT